MYKQKKEGKVANKYSHIIYENANENYIDISSSVHEAAKQYKVNVCKDMRGKDLYAVG